MPELFADGSPRTPRVMHHHGDRGSTRYRSIRRADMLGRMTTRWLGVEPRHLTALQAIRDCGSFRNAANELGLAQSALSRRVAQLEELVDASLIERAPGAAGARLTDTGARLADHAANILAEFHAAFAD